MCHVKRFTSKTQKRGEKGEKIAVMFLVKHGFRILERNYTKKCGEIDIIAVKHGVLRFIEVKTGKSAGYDPVQNMHAKKMRRFTNTCQIFLLEKHVSHVTPWQIDVVIVLFDGEEGKCHVKLLENIVL